MRLNDVLLESLLHEEEGPALDFKGYQYQFDKASDEQKSELLKDILAFANTKRETPAYVLIGVAEVKGGRSKVVGIQKHLDDAHLHQFVNSKTQRSVEFSYYPYPTDGQGIEIGVIEIPVQEGLFHLKQSFGKLRANLVYIRDGSSTRTATIAEIIEMNAPKRPEFVLAWADSVRSPALLSPYTTTSLILYPPLPDDTFRLPPTPVPKWNGIEIPTFSDSIVNSKYSQELIEHTFYNACFKPLGLQLHNASGVAATRVLFEGTLKKQDRYLVLDKIPPFPQREISRFSIPDIHPLARVHDAHMELQESRDHWKISVEFGDIRPDEKITTVDNLWFGSLDSGVARLEGKLLGENIPKPIQCSLDIQFEVERRPMTEEDVHALVRASAEDLGDDHD